VSSLREFRKSTGLSQDNMARNLRVSLSMYEKVERGHVYASRAFMQKLKRAFPSVNIDIMFFNNEELEKAGETDGE